MNGTELLTNEEAAALLRCTKTTLWRLRRQGRIAFNRIAGRILFRRSDLEAFLERTRHNARANDRHERNENF